MTYPRGDTSRKFSTNERQMGIQEKEMRDEDLQGGVDKPSKQPKNRTETCVREQGTAE